MKTFSTGDTILFSNRFHMGDEAMLCHLEDVRSWYIETGLDAAQAHDASIKPLPNQRGSIGDGRKLSFFRRKLIFLDPEFIGTVLELTLSSGIADRAVQRMVDQQ
jgi:hypothetical protein